MTTEEEIIGYYIRVFYPHFYDPDFGWLHHIRLLHVFRMFERNLLIDVQNFEASTLISRYSRKLRVSRLAFSPSKI
jgi:hypothetical protein